MGNGTYTTYDYDADGQILHLINFAPDGTILSRFDYTYDSRGRRTAMTTLEGTWHYTYDDLGQLTGWTAPDGQLGDLQVRRDGQPHPGHAGRRDDRLHDQQPEPVHHRRRGRPTPTTPTGT